ncbi:magnesium transporter CorA family protein [Lactococcus lactis]|uniref:magnesium transporter CorA family protein n=1 Tax=Lactococcus lactis TaxID=1358 RepID=UPI00223A73F2|nr:magnesium transporter CorA family protein [Lactococcus lactis]MCT1170854.1 magnesium transporter CorA family protein [Lactococcus lactis]
MSENLTREWINFSDQKLFDKSYLSKTYHIPEEFLSYATDRDESARIEIDDETKSLLIIFDMPFEDQTDVAYYSSGPMSFIVTKEVIITNIADKKMATILKNSKLLHQLNPKHKTSFVLHFMLAIAKIYVDKIRILNRKRILIEQTLGKAPKNEDLINLMKIDRSLIYFIMSLKSNSLVISKIKSGKYLKLYDDEKELLDDLMIEVDQAFDMSNISNRILNEMTDSYDSIINNNTNSVMKFLTSYSIILTIPTIIFSFYGMNVPLPLTNLPKISWEIICLLALFLSVLLTLFFVKKDYFSKR